MTETRRNPAILAGLLGSAAWGAPRLAFASPLDGVVDTVSHSLVLQFVIGCAIGAAIAGIVSLVTSRISPEDEQIEEIEQWGEQYRTHMSANVTGNLSYDDEDDPTGDLGRFRTVRRSSANATGARHFATSAVQAAPTAAPAASAGRHAAHLASAHVVAQAPEARTPRHFASSVQAPTKQAEGTARGRHFAASVEAAQAGKAEVRVSEPVARKSSASPQKTGETLQSRLESLPVVDESSQQLPVPVASQAQRDEYVDAAQSYVRKLTLRERMQLRAKGVAEVLSERIGADPLEGVPVITRADGTVGDIEVRPSWFDQTLAPALASITGNLAGKVDDTAPHGVTTEVAEQDATSAAAASPETAPVQKLAYQDRAAYISQRVSEVNTGMFPEPRSSDELSGKDSWETALAAMDENIRQDSPVFQDVVGGPSTIDDPDGLEGPTGFIPFRVPAGRPEVIDTESYIDYLLKDELLQNSSQALRRSSRSYLRVIEGGTNPLRIRRRMSDTGTVVRGRHFDTTPYAAEA